MPTSSAAREQEPNAPRSRKGVQTRARLVEAAKQVFEETGFLEARVSDIAERAGLSHGSFYHYFDSKDQIFREVADQQEAHLTAPPDPDELDADGAPSSEFDRILSANRRYLSRYRENGKIMGVIEEVSRYDAHVNATRLQRQRHFTGRAEASIERLQAEGLADPDVDPEVAALALGAMVGRFAELWLVDNWGPYGFDHAVEQLTRLWANAIGLRQPSSRRR